MRIAAALLCAAVFAGGAAAQEADPLKSAACGDALAALQAAREARAPAAQAEALRQQAARTCLGTGAPPQRPGRVAQLAQAVPPPTITPPGARPLPAPVLPPPPVAIQRPPAPAHCNAGGCWVDDGTHLRHVPPTLAGPRGLCSQHGGLVYCP